MSMILVLYYNRLKVVVFHCTLVLLFALITSANAITSDISLQHPKIIEDNDEFVIASSNKTVSNNKSNDLKSYIVLLKSNTAYASSANSTTGNTISGTTMDVPSTMDNLMRTSAQGKADHVLTQVYKGSTVSGMSNEHMKQILDNDDVESGRRDSETNIFPTGFEDLSITTQINAGWNLDILTEAFTDNTYKYKYTGEGVTVYLFSSGIDVSQEEFGGRASCGWNRGLLLKSCNDRYGLGTILAGVVGSKTYGVAKNVKLVAVKVSTNTGGGLVTTAVAGINWVIRQKRKNPNKPMIILMPLATAIPGLKRLQNAATRAATDAGIIFVTPAYSGNRGNPCLYAPMSEPTAITVGAMDSNNTVATFARGGPCVDIMAPGVDIKSVTSSVSTEYTKSIYSGSSWAAAHVAGVAALHLQRNNSLTPNDVWNEIRNGAREGLITNPNGYELPDLLLSANSLL